MSLKNKLFIVFILILLFVLVYFTNSPVIFYVMFTISTILLIYFSYTYIKKEGIKHIIKSHRFRKWFLIFSILAFLDVFITIRLIRIGGIVGELNKIVVFLFNNFSYVGYLLFVLCVYIILFLVTYILVLKKEKFMFRLIVVVYCLVVVNNLIAYSRYIL